MAYGPSMARLAGELMLARDGQRDGQGKNIMPPLQKNGGIKYGHRAPSGDFWKENRIFKNYPFCPIQMSSDVHHFEVGPKNFQYAGSQKNLTFNNNENVNKR